MYFMVKSRIHAVTNFLRPPEPTKIRRICPLISGQCRIPQYSVKTQKIPQRRANAAAQLSILRSTENCGPTNNAPSARVF